MSAQDVRNEIIKESLPELIKQLTGFAEGDQDTRKCEQLTWTIVRKHRHLSTNSHEVRRKIEGIQEKFRVDNYAEYADYLGRLCTRIAEHPQCQDHYEVDVQWSLLDLFLTLAYNPTGALKRNEYTIDIHSDLPKEDGSAIEKDIEYWRNILKDTLIPAVPITDSDLSDWSDDTTELHPQDFQKSVTENKELSKFNGSAFEKQCIIKPPKKVHNFILRDNANAKERLLNSIQHSWWLPGPKAYFVPIESDHTEATFALHYSRYLFEKSNNVLRYKEPSLATEQCLMREILWMFNSPQNCKFFTLKDSDGTIMVQKNVSIPSTSVYGLSSYLEHNFVPYMRMMQTLRDFFDRVYKCEDFTPPSTFESYAANLRLLLKPIIQEQLNYEKRLMAQRNFEINTIIDLENTLRSSFQTLACIYEIHQRAVPHHLWKYPAHISSAYLLASLMKCNRNASNAKEANLAMSLFLASMRVFCVIIDTWWTEGRLDDWQQEYLVEFNSDGNICARLFRKNKAKSFFVKSNISELITKNSVFNLLLEHSLEAGYTLNLLYEISRISDLRGAGSAIQGKLHHVYIEEVLKYLRTLQSELPTCEAESAVKIDDDSESAPNETVDGVDDDVASEWATPPLSDSDDDDDILQNLTTKDEFLWLTFAGKQSKRGDECDIACNTSHTTSCDDALSIFKQLQQSKVILPLEQIVLSTLSRILKARIAFANSFVVELYCRKFDIAKHLRNIRQVLLMESSDLMYEFYDKLFKQMDSGQQWADPYMLSTQLHEIFGSKFPEMSALFRFNIRSYYRCRNDKPFEAMNELIVMYNLSCELAHVISEDDIYEYNRIFRFLLKVKWGMWALENMLFPRSHKRRIPYAPFGMLDLLMRRWQQLRFWMMFTLQTIHTHLMTQVLQSFGEQLDMKISKCRNLKEMEAVHRSYISTVIEHCFLEDCDIEIMRLVEQLLNIIYIMRLEWYVCTKSIENNSNDPIVVDLESSSSGTIEPGYASTTQIDSLELNYVRCHQFLANRLNTEVYSNQRTFLSGLSAAFNASIPH